MLYDKDLNPARRAAPAVAKGVLGIWERDTYKPPKDEPTRPGALDAARIPSLQTGGHAVYPRHHA